MRRTPVKYPGFVQDIPNVLSQLQAHESRYSACYLWYRELPCISFSRKGDDTRAHYALSGKAVDGSPLFGKQAENGLSLLRAADTSTNLFIILLKQMLSGKCSLWGEKLHFRSHICCGQQWSRAGRRGSGRIDAYVGRRWIAGCRPSCFR